MRRFVVLLGMAAFAAFLIAPASALGGNPTVNHFKASFTDTDTDFCGTGQTVNISTSVTVTEFLTPNQPNIDYRNTSEGNTVLTNPANGNTVIVHFAGAFTATLVSGTLDGAHTELDTNIGLPELIKTPNGGVLTRDAGYIQFLNTFDSNGDFVSGEIVIDRGPHPEAEQDFNLFCTVVPAALGL
jgi:hypothetical protein